MDIRTIPVRLAAIESVGRFDSRVTPVNQIHGMMDDESEVAGTVRIVESLRANPPQFLCSSSDRGVGRRRNPEALHVLLSRTTASKRSACPVGIDGKGEPDFPILGQRHFSIKRDIGQRYFRAKFGMMRYRRRIVVMVTGGYRSEVH